MREVNINTQHIRLDQLLKWANLVSSGGEAKILITEGNITVNDQVETGRSKKVYPGDVIGVPGVDKIKVCSQP